MKRRADLTLLIGEAPASLEDWIRRFVRERAPEAGIASLRREGAEVTLVVHHIAPEEAFEMLAVLTHRHPVALELNEASPRWGARG